MKMPLDGTVELEPMKASEVRGCNNWLTDLNIGERF